MYYTLQVSEPNSPINNRRTLYATREILSSASEQIFVCGSMKTGLRAATVFINHTSHQTSFVKPFFDQQILQQNSVVFFLTKLKFILAG